MAPITRLLLALATAGVLAACSTPPKLGPAGQPDPTDVNPISGQRGGSGARN